MLLRESGLVNCAHHFSFFLDDMIHGEDERKITRVDNPKQMGTPSSLTMQATPGSTCSEALTTPPTHLANQNGSYTWVEAGMSAGNEWNFIGQESEQR